LESAVLASNPNKEMLGVEHHGGCTDVDVACSDNGCVGALGGGQQLVGGALQNPNGGIHFHDAKASIGQHKAAELQRDAVREVRNDSSRNGVGSILHKVLQHEFRRPREQNLPFVPADPHEIPTRGAHQQCICGG
jgi:hypothetical protein